MKCCQDSNRYTKWYKGSQLSKYSSWGDADFTPGGIMC